MAKNVGLLGADTVRQMIVHTLRALRQKSLSAKDRLELIRLAESLRQELRVIATINKVKRAKQVKEAAEQVQQTGLVTSEPL